MAKRECVCNCEDTLEDIGDKLDGIEQRLDEIEEHLNQKETDYGDDYEDEDIDDYVDIEDEDA